MITDRGAELVRAAQGGDTLAMADLLDELTPYVARICGGIALGGGADAAQETLIVVFRTLKGLRDPQALRGWVRVIAVREAVRVARQDSRAVPVELSELPDRGTAHLAADIRAVLAGLSPEHRAILVLRDLEGLDEQATAELLAVSKGTVKSRLHRARASFRKAWTS
ncbi:RNA polymerase sigma24 factor [Longispora fulva]|uniref:RNA polymerase sigma-70 factor (ECF subfamily) n=1 Tax=Longispora fulva TaxID=619741 RepID=A0A8J7KEL1_9ACTN|nr:sigma-70 family RNA polymerase sigma factor [Longispora fulva]MBG6135120.1 RNA polymerase sigma-70 factor (ECF subfamily) [Longispora fulva]GIG56645.1 RNA polymerase sigma24 factor [Longispora fulva]